MERAILCLLALFPILSQAVSLDNISFTPGAGDLSMSYLGLIFGSVPGSGLASGTNQLIGQIFTVFNTGVLVMTMGIVGYTVFTTTVGVSQEGSGAFQTKISPWVTLRITAGSSLLIPSFSGYSAIQVLVMTIVVKSIGFANLIWSEIIDYVASDRAIIVGGAQSSSIPLSTRTTNTISNLKSINLTDLSAVSYCVWAFNRLSDGPKGPDYQVDTNTNTITINAYLKSSTGNSYALVPCGTISTTQPNTLNSLRIGVDTIVMTAISQLNLNNNALACNNGQCFNTVNFYYTAWSILYAQAGSVTFTPTSSNQAWANEAKNRGWITAAAYYSKLVSLEKSTSPTDSLPGYEANTNYAPRITITKNLSQLPQAYQTNANTFNTAAQVASYNTFIDNSMPTGTQTTSTSTDPSGPAAQIASAILNGYGKTFGESWSNGPIGLSNLGVAGTGAPGLFGGRPYFAFDHMVVLTNTVVTKLTGCSVAKCSGSGSFDQVGCTLLEKSQSSCDAEYMKNNGFLGMLYKQQQGFAFDPLDQMRSLGVVMIQAAVNYWKTTLDVMYQKTVYLAWATFGVRIAINLPSTILTAALYGWGPGFAVVAQGVQSALNAMLDVITQLIKAAFEVYVPFGTALATAFFSMGVVLGIYLPFMPYLLYIFGAVGWLIGVAESLVAAPLVAMGVTHPEGHDLLGKAEQSLMLLLGIFVRPATMLIGFIFAINLASVAVSLLNIGFMNVFIDFMKSASSDPLVISINLVGTMLVYTYVMMSVLDQAYSLIYQIPDRILRWIGGPADSPGAGAAQAAREVKQQTQSAGSQAGQGAGQSMRAPSIPVDSSAGSGNAKDLHQAFKENNDSKNKPSSINKNSNGNAPGS